MPVYDYECRSCGPFSAFRPMAEYDKPAVCDGCGGSASRAFLTAPAIAAMDGAVRRGLAVNERSRHEPRRSFGSHPSGCGCCKTSMRSTATAAGAAKSFAGRRPWMISH